MIENKITASKSSLVLGENPLNIDGFFLSEKSTNVCPNGRQSVLIRNPNAVSEPILLSAANRLRNDEDKFILDLTDKNQKNYGSLTLSPSNEGIRFHLKIESYEPIWIVEWKISGLILDEIIIPALGGQSLNQNMPEGNQVSYKYPFWWNAQFAIGTTKNDEGLFLHSKDDKPELKMLRVLKEKNSFELTLGFEAPAPLNLKSYETEWFLDSFSGGWKNAVDKHRTWLEEKFNLKSFYDNKYFPDWGNDINFILEIWGARRDKEFAMHTFDQMTEKIKKFSKFHNPEETLLYLPGFAEHGIDSNAPDYNPSEQCGGEEKFKLLIEKAHQLGYHVMIHTNVLAMTFGHRLFEKFKVHQVVDAFGRPQTWGLDIDGDWLAEPYFAYINPSAKEWTDLMEEVIGNLINKFKVDAVFLDQTLLAFNVSQGENFLSGMRNHVKRLQEKFSKILFAGEGLHEQILPVLTMAQIHGIDSIAEVHGIDGQVPWRNVHPVSSYLFGKYTRYTAHLLTKYPLHPLFAAQEKAYEKLGVIPALVLYSDEQEIDLPETHKMIERAKSLNLIKSSNEKN
ncbi:MAG: DUF6259 domain-containing protein [Ignavibacteriaceae bacterium]